MFWKMGFVVVGVLVCASCFALENDPYLSWGVELKDSTPVLDAYVQSQLDAAYQKTDLSDLGASSADCEEAARRIFNRMRHRYWVDREFHLDEVLEKVELYPAHQDVGLVRLFKMSIYGSFKKWPFFMPLDRTFNLNGVYTSADKLSHFISQGAKYNQIYLDAVREGASETVAMQKAIQWGMGRENGLYGKYSSAVFSYADLEANWSGFLAIREVCSGPSPTLRWSAATGWRFVAPLLISKYVSPLWDESFNTSRFIFFRWNGVRPRLKKYCEMRKDPRVLRRFAEYQARYVPSFSEQYLRSLEATGKLKPQAAQSLNTVCDDAGVANE